MESFGKIVKLILALCGVGAISYFAVKEYKKAVKIARKLAKLNNVEAQNMLGLCYESGYGVKQSYTEAAKWFTLAAEQGHEYAKKELDFMGF